MGRGFVPVGISLADADQGAVPHVDRDQEALSFSGGDGSLSEDHMVCIDIVVDGFKLLHRVEFAFFHDDFRDDPPVQGGISLHQLHVMDIVVKQIPLAPG